MIVLLILYTRNRDFGKAMSESRRCGTVLSKWFKETAVKVDSDIGNDVFQCCKTFFDNLSG